MAAELIVRGFCSAWEARDLLGIMGFLSPGIEYQNVPRPAMIGHDAVRAFVAPLVNETVKLEFKLHHLAVADDGVHVLTERLDILHYASGRVLIPIMGIFRVEQDHITHWRDYPDSSHVSNGFAAIGIAPAPNS